MMHRMALDSRGSTFSTFFTYTDRLHGRSRTCVARMGYMHRAQMSFLITEGENTKLVTLCILKLKTMPRI